MSARTHDPLGLLGRIAVAALAIGAVVCASAAVALIVFACVLGDFCRVAWP